MYIADGQLHLVIYYDKNASSPHRLISFPFGR